MQGPANREARAGTKFPQPRIILIVNLCVRQIAPRVISRAKFGEVGGCPHFLAAPRCFSSFLPVAIACYALSIMEACHNIWNLKWQRDSREGKRRIKGRAYL